MMMMAMNVLPYSRPVESLAVWILLGQPPIAIDAPPIRGVQSPNRAARRSELLTMPTFTTPIQVGNPAGGNLSSVTAVVDTGADHSMLPASLLKRLDVAPLERMRFVRDDGSRDEYGIGIARIAIDGRERPCPVVFGPDNAYMLGASTLEIFNLRRDTGAAVGKRRPLATPGSIVQRRTQSPSPFHRCISRNSFLQFGPHISGVAVSQKFSAHIRPQ